MYELRTEPYFYLRLRTFCHFFRKSTIRTQFVRNSYGFCTFANICFSVDYNVKIVRTYECTIFFLIF